MRKYIKQFLILLAVLAFIAPIIIQVIGLASIPDNLNTWSLWLTQIGFTNVVAVSILVLVILLSVNEWRYRRNNALGTRLSEIYHTRSLRDLFRPIRWLDYPLFLQHQSEYWRATSTLRHLETHPDILPQKLTRIVGFKLLGENKRGKPLLLKDAFVQSLVTGENFGRN